MPTTDKPDANDPPKSDEDEAVAEETSRYSLAGFVSDPSGMPVVLTTVVGWGQRRDEQSRTPLWATRTDRLGMFEIDRRPVGPFRSVEVAVSGHGVVPIPLEDGELPHPILVNAPERSTRQGGCGPCGGTQAAPRQPDSAELVAQPELYSSDLGGCVSVNSPDRSVDEYTQHVLVRVTQPLVAPVELETGTIDRPDDGLRMSNRPQSLPLQAALREVSLRSRGVELDTVSAFKEILAPAQIAALRREVVSTVSQQRAERGQQLVHWDEDSLLQQATTLAYGHLVALRQRWVADGYSLGTLLHSLPLAPGQRKRIAVIDWRRKESAERSEVATAQESVAASLHHDRDVAEVVKASVAEQVAGGSTSTSAGFGAGLGAGASGTVKGINLAGVLGISGGFGSATSDAWQESSRELLSSSLNQARDRVQQGASAVRGQRTSVVTTVTQQESVTTTSEVVANHNHCHAMTVQYFEVLRHLAVTTDVADVQGCVFVPLAMTPFDAAKAERWSEVLLGALLDPGLRPDFASVRYVVENAGRRVVSEYAEPVLEVFGELEVDLDVPVPLEWDDGTTSDAEHVSAETAAFLREIGADPHQIDGRPDRWRAAVARAAKRILSRSLRVGYTTGSVTGHFDITVHGDGRATGVRVTFQGTGMGVSRRALDGLTVGFGDRVALPQGSRVIVRRVRSSYRLRSGVHPLVDRVLDSDAGLLDQVSVPTPPSGVELVDQHAEHLRRAGTVVEHLNAHIEHYHHAIWRSFDAARRHLLLDGVKLTTADGVPLEQAPSVASVVRNEVVAIVGNSLVLPAVAGVGLGKLMGVAEHLWAENKDAYIVETSVDPVRVSLPTGGVYAEAVLGACNSCETKDETRYWRWEESPIDDPDRITDISAGSRATEPVSTTPSPMAAPMVAIQNVPPLPDPTAGAAALAALTTPGIFSDAMGLAGTQEGARSALQQSLQSAQAFGQQASAMVQAQAAAAARAAQTSQQLRGVQSSPDLTPTQRTQLSEQIVRAGAGLTSPAERVIQAAREAAERGEISSEQRNAAVHQALQSAAGAGASAPDLLNSPAARQAVREGGSVSAQTPDGTRVAVSGPARTAAADRAASSGGFRVVDRPEGSRVRWLLENWRPGETQTYHVGGHEYRLSAGARVPSRLAALMVLGLSEGEVVLESTGATNSGILATPQALLASPVSPDLVVDPPSPLPPAVSPSDWVIRSVHAVMGVDAEEHQALEVIATAHELLSEKRAGDAAAAKARAAVTTLAGASPQFAALLAGRFGTATSGDLPSVLAVVARQSGTGWSALLSGLATWIAQVSAWSEALRAAERDAQAATQTSLEEARMKLEQAAIATREEGAEASVQELWGWVLGHAEDMRDDALDQVADATARLTDGLTSVREIVRRLSD